jgi:F-type H+-transporting ATPase subunit epsilon
MSHSRFLAVSELKCIVVTPERTLLDKPADFVALPLYDGEIGIAPGHSPMIGRLGAGELRIQDQEGLHRYYVEGGFVEVSGGVVSVLTSRAIAAGELDEMAAGEQLIAARARPANTPDLMAQRDRAVAAARAQLRAARRAKA